MRAARILLVEDENIVARDICSRLETFGYDVIAPVATGEEALAQARLHRPNLVLMDIMLRGPMDGIEAAQQLRRELDIPVVYLTAYVDDKNLQRAKVTEPFGYLLKPFEERELHITIEIALYKHRMEQQLRESNAFNELLIQTIPFGMDIVDEEGRILFVSDNFRKQFQITGTDKRCWEVYRADRTQCENCPLQSKAHFEQGSDIEVPGITGDRIFLITHSRLTYNGKPAILEIFQDITARKRAEKALHLSEERFAKALRTSPDAISINRIADGKYVEVNEAFSEQTGYKREEVVGRSVGSLGIWADPNHRTSFLEEVRLRGEAKNVEVQFRVKDGSVKTGLLSARPIEFDGEQYMLAINRDVTDHLLLEQQLNQAQKMEGIGTLASGIAHDFNNILNNILGFTIQLKKHAADPAKVGRYALTIEKSAMRGAELSAQLLSFARKSRRENAPVDVGALVKEMAVLCGETFPANITVRTEVADGLRPVLGDRSELYQVLLNLCVNARDSMAASDRSDGHVLTIEARNAQAEGTVSPYLVPGLGEGTLELRVSDTGIGIPKEIRERIFEPFFTTKEKAKGTGLGLSVAYNVVRNHRGTILVESQDGAGATFRVFLPPAPQSDAEGMVLETSAAGTNGREGVLIVDDEPTMQELGKELLEEKGYRVFVAGNGRDALDLYAANQREIDIVVLDLVMPGMDGGQVYLELKKLNPQVKAFFCTGYLSDKVITDLLAEEDLKAIQKPVRPEVFLRTIREVLDEKPS